MLKQALLLTLAAAMLLLHGTVIAAGMQPYVLASEGSGSLDAKVRQVKRSLESQGFSVIGEYSPYDDAVVIVVTSNDLKSAAKKSDRGGYGAVQRVSVTRSGRSVQVAYVNPLYIQHAYRMNGSLEPVAKKIEMALGKKKEFGSTKKVMDEDKLRSYHYMFGMEYFSDPYVIAEFGSHKEAVAAVEAGLKKERGGVSKVYRLDLSRNQTLFGVSMTRGSTRDKYRDEAYQMSIVDSKPLKQTAYLPYEILVNGNRVEILHMRFRMAVHFPDLDMRGGAGFMKIRKSPKAINKAMKEMLGVKDKRPAQERDGLI
ncbi:MAG: hypothetical protein U9R74_07520 [Pseudomonadota bacterium]|nr:hypothetical protein [Pseudomonadota bacterium]